MKKRIVVASAATLLSVSAFEFAMLLHHGAQPHTGSSVFATTYSPSSTDMSGVRVMFPETVESLQDTVAKYMPTNPVVLIG